MGHYDYVVLKIQGFGLVMLGIFKMSGADVALWVSIPSALLSGIYWALKIYKEFIKKRKS